LDLNHQGLPQYHLPAAAGITCVLVCCYAVTPLLYAPRTRSRIAGTRRSHGDLTAQAAEKSWSSRGDPNRRRARRPSRPRRRPRGGRAMSSSRWTRCHCCSQAPCSRPTATGSHPDSRRHGNRTSRCPNSRSTSCSRTCPWGKRARPAAVSVSPAASTGPPRAVLVVRNQARTPRQESSTRAVRTSHAPEVPGRVPSTGGGGRPSSVSTRPCHGPRTGPVKASPDSQ